jgi:hypothetical protein
MVTGDHDGGMSTRTDLRGPGLGSVAAPPFQSEPTPPLGLRIPAGALRWPYCHDSCQLSESVVCRDCLARQHDECWDEAEACAACGSTERLITAAEAERFAKAEARRALAADASSASVGETWPT